MYYRHKLLDFIQTLRDFLPVDLVLSAVSVLVVVLPSFGVPEGLMNYPL
jgi:hypothetical protein